MSELPLGPADTIERRPLSVLVPYARNARTHSNERKAAHSLSAKGKDKRGRPELTSGKPALLDGKGPWRPRCHSRSCLPGRA
jgi:hypothetical protein